MATNVKILLRRGLRNELSGDTLSAGELGYTTDTNQLYVGVEEAITNCVLTLLLMHTQLFNLGWIVLIVQWQVYQLMKT